MDNEKFQELVINQLSSLAEDVKGVKSDVETVKKDVDTVKSHQQGVEKDVETLKSYQLRMETKIENEVIDKVRALFDNRELHNDNFKIINTKLSEMDDKLDYALLQITKHEVKLLSQRKLPK